jgi:hypothetical protein
MKKSHIVVISSAAALLIGFAGFWVYGCFYIKKTLKENPAVKVEQVNITGFPLSYKIDLKNITLEGKVKDSYLIKGIEANLELFTRNLNIKTVDGITITSNITGNNVVKHYNCNVPTTTNFKYKDFFWFVKKAPEIKNFSYVDKDCRLTNSDNQELLRLDDAIVRVDTIKDHTSFSMSSKGFKDHIFEGFKIGDFKFDLKGELTKAADTINDKKQSKDQVVVAGEKVKDAHLEVNLESAVKANAHFNAILTDKGYESSSEILISSIEDIVSYAAGYFKVSKDIILKMVESASTKEADMTKITFKLDPKNGPTIGGQSVNDLIKKYFLLQQTEAPKPVQ